MEAMLDTDTGFLGVTPSMKPMANSIAAESSQGSPMLDRTSVGLELRVLLISDEASLTSVAQAVELSGHTLLARAATADEALAAATTQSCNAVLLAVPFENGNGLELCAKLQLLGPMPVILIGDPIDPALLQNAEGAGVVGCVSKGASVSKLAAAMTLGATWFRAARRLHAERDELAAQNRQLILTLENRKLIERAKGIYMRLHGLQEAEAHRRLQTESQKRRLALAELARKVIESDELLGR